jgi:flagellar biosynthetic protein FliR
MNEALAQLLGLSQEAIFAGFVVFLRVGATMSILPAFGEQSIPQRVRLVLTLGFTLIVAPAVFPVIQLAMTTKPLIGLYVAGEVLVGLLMGIGVRLFVLTLQVAGSIAAQSTSLSQIFGAAGVDPQPAIGHLLVVSGLAVAVSMDLHVHVAAILVSSYDIFPPGSGFSSDLISQWGADRTAFAFSLAFSLAAPFVIASLIYNIALGVINRAMPQLMVAFVGAPAITAGGLLLLFVSMPIILTVWSNALMIFLADPFAGAP